MGPSSKPVGPSLTVVGLRNAAVPLPLLAPPHIILNLFKPTLLSSNGCSAQCNLSKPVPKLENRWQRWVGGGQVDLVAGGVELAGPAPNSVLGRLPGGEGGEAGERSLG